MSITGKFILFSIFLLLRTNYFAIATRRSFKYSINQDCQELCDKEKVLLSHVEAIGPNDVVHYIWDFTYNKNPTIFVALTPLKSKLKIDWPNYLNGRPGCIQFSIKPIYSLGVVIERILEFNDVQDHARIDEIIKSDDITEIKFNDFHWKHGNLTEENNSIQLLVEAYSYTNNKTSDFRNGSIQFLLNGFSSLNHSSIAPFILHSENSTQADIIFNKFDTNKNYSSSRFAIELLVISEHPHNNSFIFNTTKSIDDEYTPGIFEVMRLHTPEISENNTGYLLWRPISYLNPDRKVTESTEIVTYLLKYADIYTVEANNSFINLYYGKEMENFLVQKFNMSIGDKGDGFYNSSRFSTWTFLIGCGYVPPEKFFTKILSLISVLVFIPLIVLAVTTTYYMVFRTNHS